MKRILLALLACLIGSSAFAQSQGVVFPAAAGCSTICAISTSLAIGGAAIGTDALAITGSITASAKIVGNGGFQIGNGASYSSAFGDTFFGRGAAATWKLGGAASASPVAYTWQGDASRSGTDTNIGGANFTLQGGNGTGTGTLSSLILQSPVAVGSGTGAQTQTTGLTIVNGTAVTKGYTVSTLPSVNIAGARAHVTDAVACTFLATLTGGGSTFCPVVNSGSGWTGG